jgi:hypothetical protein
LKVDCGWHCSPKSLTKLTILPRTARQDRAAMDVRIVMVKGEWRYPSQRGALTGQGEDVWLVKGKGRHDQSQVLHRQRPVSVTGHQQDDIASIGEKGRRPRSDQADERGRSLLEAGD